MKVYWTPEARERLLEIRDLHIRVFAEGGSVGHITAAAKIRKLASRQSRAGDCVNTPRCWSAHSA
jgi:hypothetical protein